MEHPVKVHARAHHGAPPLLSPQERLSLKMEHPGDRLDVAEDFELFNLAKIRSKLGLEAVGVDVPADVVVGEEDDEDEFGGVRGGDSASEEDEAEDYLDRLDRELNEMYADYQARVQRRSVAEISMANKDAPMSKKKVRSELRAAEEAPEGEEARARRIAAEAFRGMDEEELDTARLEEEEDEEDDDDDDDDVLHPNDDVGGGGYGRRQLDNGAVPSARASSKKGNPLLVDVERGTKSERAAHDGAHTAAWFGQELFAGLDDEDDEEEVVAMATAARQKRQQQLEKQANKKGIKKDDEAAAPLPTKAGTKRRAAADADEDDKDDEDDEDDEAEATESTEEEASMEEAAMEEAAAALPLKRGGATTKAAQAASRVTAATKFGNRVTAAASSAASSAAAAISSAAASAVKSAVKGAVTSSAVASAVTAFIAVSKFGGSRLGYVFKRGHLGVGYYLDAKQQQQQQSRKPEAHSNGAGNSSSSKGGGSGAAAAAPLAPLAPPLKQSSKRQKLDEANKAAAAAAEAAAAATAVGLAAAADGEGGDGGDRAGKRKRNRRETKSDVMLTVPDNGKFEDLAPERLVGGKRSARELNEEEEQLHAAMTHEETAQAAIARQAEAIVLGQLLLNPQKRRALEDLSYTRHTRNDPPGLPQWFVDDERKYAQPSGYGVELDEQMLGRAQVRSPSILH